MYRVLVSSGVIMTALAAGGPGVAAPRDVTVPPSTAEITLRKPPELRLFVERPSLPAVDIRGSSMEVQVAWRAVREAEFDARAGSPGDGTHARVDAATERAAVVLERESARLDAAGWLALADLRRRRAMKIFQDARDAADRCDRCPEPVFDGGAALAAYAEVERRDGIGELALIARYYAADVLGQSPSEEGRVKSLVMLRAVAASRTQRTLRTHALMQLACAAVEDRRWREAADLAARALASGSPSWARESMTHLRVLALHRARRSTELLAVVTDAAHWFSPGDDLDEMLDLAASALDILGSTAPAPARIRFGQRLDEIRRREGAADADIAKVAGAVVARCFRVADAPCESHIFGGASCRTVVLEGTLADRGRLTTRVLSEGPVLSEEIRLRRCLDGPQPPMYGSGLSRPSRFIVHVRVQREK